jgi:CRP/FNR family transcriptional regulator, cyclic AMP receptor protein
MVEFTPPPEQFKQQIRQYLLKSSVGWRVERVAKRDRIYTSGERNDSIYYLESGQVKLLLQSYEGKECLVSIRTAGDLFGELCLTGHRVRLESAVAMRDSILKRTSAREFLANIRSSSLMESFVQYLTLRLSEHQEVIAAMATINSEQRLAKTLLHLGRMFGKEDSRGRMIAERISHEELSEMVGTTRPRVGILLKKFRQLGLVGVNAERCLFIEERKMNEHLLAGSFTDRSGYEQNSISA